MIEREDEYYDDGVIPDDADGFDELSCGLMDDGHCANIGTEWCDWRCPYSSEATHNKIRKRKERAAPLLEALADAIAAEQVKK